MTRPLRLLSIGHSYVVALNRRLAHEMARVGGNRWEVTAVAPKFMHGDLRPIRLEPSSDEACRLEALPTFWTNRIHFMFYGGRIRQLINQQWDLIHGWVEPYIIAGGQIAWLVPRGTPFVFWTAQNLSKTYPLPFAWIEKYCVSRCHGWLACGQTTLQTQLNRGYDKKPHRVIPLGVDLDAIRPSAAARDNTRHLLAWPVAGPPVIGYLGRFVPEKGITLLMRVLDRISTPWRALFVGGGPMEGALRSWANQYQDRVRVVTGVPHDKVPDYLNSMDLLCAPSQTTPIWREQLGRMLIEAFACGVPVVASDSGEIPYVVRDAGIIVGEAEEEGWVKSVSELLESPARRAELASRGLVRVQEEFAWQVVARQHLNFFEKVLNHA